MEIALYLLLGLIIGLVIGILYSKNRENNHGDYDKLEEENLNLKNLERELIADKAGLDQALTSSKELLDKANEELENLKNRIRSTDIEFAQVTAQFRTSQEQVSALKKELELIKEQLEQKTIDYNEVFNAKSVLKANLEAADKKLERQKEDIAEMQKTFKLEFEKMASSILDQKTAKFTQTNHENLKTILDPLNKDIEAFKKRVNEVYEKESQERFSLGQKVKELQTLNKTISEEAKNLTQALKGEVKTQGNWGEMILERILENSGLRKGEEYEMEVQLTDDQGKALRSDSEDKKMRPDAVINYPDNRKVIIDSKVSLNAFSRSVEADTFDAQQEALNDHVRAIKNHIISLSAKGYDDYDKALDFVLMFVPSESAYIAAIKQDPELWNFAYSKRILLMNPTNLITSLKLISDLWKREYQNQNAIAIAERGGKLYDKFVGFVNNMEKIGDHLTKAQKSYSDAYGQLNSGKDNLVRQATKLKELGVKTKKELPDQFKSIE